MAVTVRVVALGIDNGTTVAIQKSWAIDPRPGETRQQVAERVRREAQEDLRDWIQDGIRVAMSNMQVSAGVV